MLQIVSLVLSLASIAGLPTSFQKYWKQPFWISSSSSSSASENLYCQAARLSGEATMSAGSVVTGSRAALHGAHATNERVTQTTRSNLGNAEVMCHRPNNRRSSEKMRAFAIHDTRTGHRPRLAGVPCVNAAILPNEAGGRWCRGPRLKLTCSVGGFPSNQRSPSRTTQRSSAREQQSSYSPILPSSYCRRHSRL